METTKNNPGKMPSENNKNEMAASKSRDKKKMSGKDLFAGIIAIVLVALAGTMLYVSNDKHKNEISEIAQEKTELSEKLNERDQLIDEMVSTFNQIETDLHTITEKENFIAANTEDIEITKTKKEQVIEDIKLISSLLEDNKKKIQRLNAQIKKSGVQIASLESKILNLEKSLLIRDSSINELRVVLVQKDFEIAGLSDRIYSMETTIDEQNNIINTQIHEKNKAYLTTGNYKELNEKGILEKDGGFLGIGKEVKLQKNIKEAAFNEIDILNTKIIPVNAKKAELITNHPAGSYYFVTDSTETIAHLEIKDPNSFWKISKYAVVETK